MNNEELVSKLRHPGTTRLNRVLGLVLLGAVACGTSDASASRGVTTTVVGPGSMAVFDATEQKWRPASGGARAKVELMPGGGKLLRLAGLQE